MGNFIYPNSATRKMYGEVGRKLALAAKRHNADIESINRIHSASIHELRAAVTAYESLGWWKRLWMLILEIFGKRKSILPK